MENLLSQRSNESNKNYELLCKYATTGFDRNITSFADSVGLSRQQIHNISNQNNWNERISKLDKQLSNELSLDVYSKLRPIKQKELEENITTYENLKKALSIANDSFSKVDIEEMDCESVLKLSSKYLNIILKSTKMTEALEEKLNFYDLPENTETVQIERTKSTKSTQILPQKRELTDKENEVLDELNDQLLEIELELEDKTKLKKMGHRKSQKLFKKRNDIRNSINKIEYEPQL